MMDLYKVEGLDINYVVAGNINHVMTLINEEIDFDYADFLNIKKLEAFEVAQLILDLDKEEATKLVIDMMETGSGFILDEDLKEIVEMVEREGEVNKDRINWNKVMLNPKEFQSIDLRLTLEDYSNYVEAFEVTNNHNEAITRVLEKTSKEEVPKEYPLTEEEFKKITRNLTHNDYEIFKATYDQLHDIGYTLNYVLQQDHVFRNERAF